MARRRAAQRILCIGWCINGARENSRRRSSHPAIPLQVRFTYEINEMEAGGIDLKRQAPDLSAHHQSDFGLLPPNVAPRLVPSLDKTERGSWDHDGHVAVFLVRCPHGDFDVLPEGGKKLHQAFERVGTGLAAHQARDVWLPNAEDCSGLGLREPTFVIGHDRRRILHFNVTANPAAA